MRRLFRAGLKPGAYVLLILLSACTSGPGPVDSAAHDAETREIRARKDVFFKEAKDSPLPEDKRASFPGLAYWDIKPEFHVSSYLTVDRTGPPMIITLQTSTNVPRKMRRVGALGFTLNETGYKLTAFADIDDTAMKRLFVPFGDLTNKKETYGGGRYLDLNRSPTGFYDLDFNRAYHPYCVFNTSFECPVPPRENRLEVEIPAGERLNCAVK